MLNYLLINLLTWILIHAYLEQQWHNFSILIFMF